MESAAVDAVAFIIMNTNRNYIETINEIQAKTGFILQPIYQKPDIVSADALAKMLKLKRRICRRTLFAGLLHSETGLAYPVVYLKNSKGVKVEFHGLCQYKKEHFELTEKSELMRMDLSRLLSSGLNLSVCGLDVAIDSPKLSKSLITAITRKREPQAYKTTLYFQTDANAKTANRYLQIYLYDKKTKNRLAYPLQRLEFSFKAAALDAGKNFDDVINKAAAKVARWVDVKKVKIDSFWRVSA